jgi:hypothetical protein
MADPRILNFQIPVISGISHFQIQFSMDSENWETVSAANVTELPASALDAAGAYELDGVNTTDSGTENRSAASTPPMRYRTRTKVASKWSVWSEAFVFPSVEDFIQSMKQQLKDPGLTLGTPLLTDQDYRLHVGNAVEAFEKRYGAVLSETIDLTSGTRDYSLPWAWTPGYSSIVQVEYPVGNSPRSFIPNDWVIVDESGGQWRFRRGDPDAGSQARLYFTARHARDGSTVPVAFFNSVLMWATGDAAMQVRAYKNQFGDVHTGADYMGIDPRIREWGKIADSFKKQAEETWGTGMTSARTNIAAYEDHGLIPARVRGW